MHILEYTFMMLVISYILMYITFSREHKDTPLRNKIEGLLHITTMIFVLVCGFSFTIATAHTLYNMICEFNL